MWPVIMQAARIYGPYIAWPFAFVIGVVGYNFEAIVRGTPKDKAIMSKAEIRAERELKEQEGKDLTQVDHLKDATYTSTSFFEKVPGSKRTQ